MKKVYGILWVVFSLTFVAGCGKGVDSMASEEVSREATIEFSEESIQESSEEPVLDTECEEGEQTISEEENVAVSATTDIGPLHVEGTQLVDSTGNTVQLRGISTHGLAWFPQYVNQEFFTELHDEWNANVVRLAMYTAESGGYCSGGSQDDLKQLVKDGVKYATEADMYVNIDWHILRDANPNQNKEDAKKFFAEMSKEFGGADNVLYEICNEPNGGTTWSEIKSYAEEVIPVIRSNDEDAIIIVGTPTWSQEVDKAAADPIKGYDNIMYALHFYAATHTDWLRDRMVKAIDAGLPIFVTEFGTCDASGDGGINVEQSNKWIQTMDECGVSYVAWNLSNKAETSAIFQSNCGKTSGFAAEDLTENGKWIYEMLTGEHAERLVSGSNENDKSAEATTSQNDAQNAVQSVAVSNNNSSIEGTNESLTYTAVITNSWESDGQTYSQYTLTIENTSGQNMDNWSVTLNFDEAIIFSDGWNANFTVENNTLVISPVEYNSQIPAGGSISDIGFIISSPMN